jgi:hypothetical protein
MLQFDAHRTLGTVALLNRTQVASACAFMKGCTVGYRPKLRGPASMALERLAALKDSAHPGLDAWSTMKVASGANYSDDARLSAQSTVREAPGCVRGVGLTMPKALAERIAKLNPRPLVEVLAEVFEPDILRQCVLRESC